MKNVKNEEFHQFKISKSEIFQKYRLETTTVRAEDQGCKSNQVTFGKAKVHGSQHTINHIDNSLTTRYIHIEASLYWWKYRQIKKIWIFKNLNIVKNVIGTFWFWKSKNTFQDSFCFCKVKTTFSGSFCFWKVTNTFWDSFVFANENTFLWCIN